VIKHFWNGIDLLTEIGRNLVNDDNMLDEDFEFVCGTLLMPYLVT